MEWGTRRPSCSLVAGEEMDAREEKAVGEGRLWAGCRQEVACGSSGQRRQGLAVPGGRMRLQRAVPEPAGGSGAGWFRGRLYQRGPASSEGHRVVLVLKQHWQGLLPMASTRPWLSWTAARPASAAAASGRPGGAGPQPCRLRRGHPLRQSGRWVHTCLGMCVWGGACVQDPSQAPTDQLRGSL